MIFSNFEAQAAGISLTDSCQCTHHLTIGPRERGKPTTPFRDTLNVICTNARLTSHTPPNGQNWHFLPTYEARAADIPLSDGNQCTHNLPIGRGQRGKPTIPFEDALSVICRNARLASHTLPYKMYGCKRKKSNYMYMYLALQTSGACILVGRSG